MKSRLSLRTLSLATALALATGAINAQSACYEPQFGTLLGTGDDTLFGIQPISFAFPFGGTTYADVHVSANGFLYLSNAAIPAPGNGYISYSPTGATLVTGQPKIAPNWHDLNILSPGGVYLNNTIPGKCVITWDQARDYGQTTVYTFQCQLFATGAVQFYFSDTTRIYGSSSSTVTGISPGGITTAPAAIDLSTAPSTTDPNVYENFVAATHQFDLFSKAVLFTPNAALGYDVTTMLCGASNETFGANCLRVTRSFYESFASGTFDLGIASPAVKSMLMVPNANGGYTVVSGQNAWFAHVAATNLALDDDSVALVTLPSVFTFPGGSTNALTVCSNGFITLNGVSTNTAYSPSGSALLAGEPRLCPAWCDLAPTLTGPNVLSEYDAASNTMFITWDGVPTYSATGSIRVQVAFDLTGMTVELRYRDCPLPSNIALAGFSPGGGALDPASRDLDMTIPFSTATDQLAITLAASPVPALGATVTYTTDNVPATSGFTANVFSFGAYVPGIDLGTIGAPGCFQHLNLGTGEVFLLTGAPTATMNVTIPTSPSWTGAVLYVQSIAFVPGINPLGAITSNAVKSTLF